MRVRLRYAPLTKRQLLVASLIAFAVAFALIAVAVFAQEKPPTYKAEVFGTNQLIFHGCINLPPLQGTQGHVCMVEDRQTHVHFVIDELVGGCATIYGQGRWIEH